MSVICRTPSQSRLKTCILSLLISKVAHMMNV